LIVPNGASWIEWDGRSLRWQNDASSPHELRIDGIAFERIAATADIVSREFDCAPTGSAQLTFSLSRDSGESVGAPWRVLYGQASAPGVDAWSGPAPRLQPLARVATGAANRKPVAIVVPIFNAPELTERCIDAVIRWTTAPARLILIDDASPDAAITPLLDRYRQRANISVMRNPANLGYTRSSNLGMQAAGDADVVLLNSDTQVGPRWLDRLRQVAYSDAAVGTVTAVSDNAGAFTVPELERFCPIPKRWSLTQTQRALLQNVSDALPELPTGNGFCMYVKRAMLDAVGLLDAAAFPAGYGEENDLCQRAERVGFRHVIAGDVFVAHARSASFGHERRAALGEQGMAILRQRYPDYENKVFTRRVLDYRVRRIYADADRLYENLPPRARVLIAGDSSVFLDATLQRYATIDAAFRIRGCDDDQASAALSDATAVREWLSAHAIEWIVAQAEQGARLESVARDAGIPLRTVAPLRQPSALEWSAAWNSVAAFRSES
jgi:GT2 family glycosyltransferase